MLDDSAAQSDSPAVVQPRDMSDEPVVDEATGAVSDPVADAGVSDAGAADAGAATTDDVMTEGVAELSETPELPAMPAMGQSEAPIVDAAEMNKTQKIIDASENASAIKEIAEKIGEVENILVALSNDPSVDDIAAAIGLTLALDKMGKHATAIYSGVTPNVLEFLEPGKTLEENADSLQDLVIALNKDKADHLRYKVDGEFVKIYITPYRTKLTQDDLSYSYGDYNVDLVIALNVRAAMSLDNVLRQHGRIMHDASAINITTEAPGRLAELEWSNPEMSSVSEMVTNLLFGMKAEMDGTIATALLAGIVGATERFKNERTFSETMKIAGRLMEAGADAQLVAENITSDGEAAVISEPLSDVNFEVTHEEPQLEVPEYIEPEPEPEPVLPEPEPTGPVDAPILNEELMAELRRQQEEANAPEPEPVDENAKDYGKMIDEALAEVNGMVPAEPAPEVTVPEAPVVEPAGVESVAVEPAVEVVAEEPVAEPELPMPGDEILPPPPTPAVDFGTPEMPNVPEMPAVEAAPAAEVSVPEAVAPAMPEVGAAENAQQNPQNPDPSEFKIPGM